MLQQCFEALGTGCHPGLTKLPTDDCNLSTSVCDILNRPSLASNVIVDRAKSAPIALSSISLRATTTPESTSDAIIVCDVVVPGLAICARQIRPRLASETWSPLASYTALSTLSTVGKGMPSPGGRSVTVWPRADGTAISAIAPTANKARRIVHSPAMILFDPGRSWQLPTAGNSV